MIVMITLLVLLVQTVHYADAPFTPLLTDSFSLLPTDNLSFRPVTQADSATPPTATNIPIPKDQADREMMGEASYAVYQLATRLGQRIEEKFDDIKSLYSPKVEQVPMGAFLFNVSLSYGWDFSRKKLNATITFDEIKKRSK
jgi:hypothetical protein